MGGGLQAELSHGAVQELTSAPEAEAGTDGMRPVLQVADVTHVPDGTGFWFGPARYRLMLSDGVHSHHATLAPDLDHLAGGGALRRGSVVHLRSFVFVPVRAPAPPVHTWTILISKLKILQTECPVIGSLKTLAAHWGRSTRFRRRVQQLGDPPTTQVRALRRRSSDHSNSADVVLFQERSRDRRR